MRSLLRRAWRLLKMVGTWIIVALILFEEWGWVPLVRLMGVVARLPLVGRVERRIAALPPQLALVLLFVPALLLLPLKIFALWLLGRGKLMLGVLILLAAKVLGTAVVARLFMLTRPQLMAIGWFARWYVRWVAWKMALTQRVRDSAGWRAAAGVVRRWRALRGGG